MLAQRIFRLGEYVYKRIFIESCESANYGKPANHFGNHSILDNVFRYDLFYNVAVLGFFVGFSGQLGIESDHFFAEPFLYNIFQTDESSAAYKEYLRGVDLYV